MKKITVILIVVFVMGMMACLANAATIGYIDSQKVFSSYEKTKKAEEQFKKKDQIFKDEVAKKQKQVEKEKSNNMSDGDLRKLIDKFEKELAPKRNDMIESQKKIMQEIQDDIVKATEAIAKRMGIEIVIDKQIIITGGTDITDKVIEQLNKK
jgi:outer membrane protein